LSKPAARLGDIHKCSRETPGPTPVPHVGGPILTGCPTVYIGGRPAAREGDICFCVGEPDIIKEGSGSVLIGGKPAARFSDMTVHGGHIEKGCMTVLIGDKKPVLELEIDEDDDEFPWPPEEERIKIINETIKECIRMLQKKLKLLKENEKQTLKEFKRWYGTDDEESKRIILKRIENVLSVSKGLTVNNFGIMRNKKDKRENYAIVYKEDKSYTIYVGNHFWNTGANDRAPKAGILIHELSHFKHIGGTEDDIYGEKRCLLLAKVDPKGALYNADTFQFFMEVQ
jgi:uncharacterized Zn-binding protein involved in type VI secretion